MQPVAYLVGGIGPWYPYGQIKNQPWQGRRSDMRWPPCEILSEGTKNDPHCEILNTPLNAAIILGGHEWQHKRAKNRFAPLHEQEQN